MQSVVEAVEKAAEETKQGAEDGADVLKAEIKKIEESMADLSDEARVESEKRLEQLKEQYEKLKSDAKESAEKAGEAVESMMGQ